MPPTLTEPPAPLITPAKVVEPDWVSVRASDPSTTVLPTAPVRLAMVAPAVVAEMLKIEVPDRVRALLVAIEPEPLSARVPALTVVAPV